jgi:peptide chain release factor 1
MRSGSVVCRAIEGYMVDKLKAAEATYKEMQMRMADPEVAGNSNEFQKVSTP